jgi:pyruvate kinase
MITALFETGADAFRLNFSHGEHADHKRRVKTIRALEKRMQRPIAIVADMQGPKLRIGTFLDGSVELRDGQAFRLDLTDKPGDAKRVSLPHPEVFAALKPGRDLLLDDGKLRLKVIKATKRSADTEVVAGGVLSDRKGVNLPNTLLAFSALTAKDRRDLAFALDLGVDYVALSFVQRPEDVAEARKAIAGKAAIMSKIEKPSAVERLEEIIDLSDAIMIARGDLGVELPVHVVPGLQKRIVRASRQAGKPVVVATQMLESMIHSPMPTRAEVSDVATAVYDGADAVMLSAETAAGDHPIEAVQTMNDIAEQVEHDPLYRGIMDADHANPEATAADAITAAARQVAETVGAAAIVTFTTSGSTTLRASRERPKSPILCLTPSTATARRMALAWGVHGVQTSDITSFSEMVRKACRIAEEQELATKGSRLVVTAGVPFGTPGSTNVLRIAWVGGQN